MKKIPLTFWIIGFITFRYVPPPLARGRAEPHPPLWLRLYIAARWRALGRTGSKTTSNPTVRIAKTTTTTESGNFRCSQQSWIVVCESPDLFVVCS